MNIGCISKFEFPDVNLLEIKSDVNLVNDRLIKSLSNFSYRVSNLLVLKIVG